MKRFCAVSTAFLFAFIATRAAADSEAERRTLAGLPGIYVHIAPTEEPLVKAGIDAASLRTEVELQLRMAGVPLLTQEQSLHTPGIPWLYLSASSVKSSQERAYGWSMRLQLRQRVCLERDPKLCEVCTTWETARFGTVGTRKLGTVKEEAGNLTKEFVNAYLAVNPKK
jgi:hypothetical protein